MTEKYASHPRKSSMCSMSLAANGSVAELMDSAMSVSSECRRGLRLCRQSVFRRQMGSMTSSLMTSISSSTPETP